MQISEINEKIDYAIQTGGTLSPFLFLSANTEVLTQKIIHICYELFWKYNIPKTSLIHIEDNWENLKVEQTRQLLQSASVRPSYDFQIFFIENISRLTLGSSNSMLKFLEEPWKWNIIFLSNKSESWILDTILSRVIQVPISTFAHRDVLHAWSTFFEDMLQKCNSLAGKQNLLAYIYGFKWEKQEYINFLQALLKSQILTSDEMSDLHDDIYAISNNNVLPKYILDKWVLKIV